MRIRKYDINYGRRKMMQNVAYGLGAGVGAGVLMPWDKLLAKDLDNIQKAYPDELLSIEAQTKGKVKVGDYIDKNNVEYVKHLLDPGTYEQISGVEGRRVYVKAPTLNPRDLVSAAYYDATLEDIHSGHHARSTPTATWRTRMARSGRAACPSSTRRMASRSGRTCA